MCFAIPYKVLKVHGKKALIENGKTVTLGNEIAVRIGDYVRIAGNVVVDSLSKKDGDAIRSTLAQLNTYEP